jgi:NADH-quinone oxidoreductase subunit G
LKSLAALLARLAGATVGVLAEGANAAGAHLAGAVPQRASGPASDAVAAASSPGLPTGAMLAARLKAYVLFGAIDPALDLAGDADALGAAAITVAITTHLPESLRAVASVVLPIGSFAETAGSFVNVEGRSQTWAGAAKLVGQSRPGWKVLRVLANLLDLPDFDYASAAEVLAALKASLPAAPHLPEDQSVAQGAPAAAAWIDVPPYQGDALVRGSESLGKTRDGQLARVVV